jgi:hypothetical protein
MSKDPYEYTSYKSDYEAAKFRTNMDDMMNRINSGRSTNSSPEYSSSTRYSSSRYNGDDTDCSCCCCGETHDREKEAKAARLKLKSEQATPNGSIKAVAGIDDPTIWAQKFDLTTSQKILAKIDEQEARIYVAPSRTIKRLHHLYNLEQEDQLYAESAQYWQNVLTAYTEGSKCCSGNDKASVMAKFLHLSEKMADFYNRREGDKAEQSVYAYTPKIQQKIKEWYQQVQQDGSIPCDMYFDMHLDALCISCCGGKEEDDIGCCEPPYAAHPQADWCCVTHILGAMWSDHPNAGCCFFQY